VARTQASCQAGDQGILWCIGEQNGDKSYGISFLAILE